MTERKIVNQLVQKQSQNTVSSSSTSRIPPIHVHVDSATTVLVHIKKAKEKKNLENVKNETKLKKPSSLVMSTKNCISPVIERVKAAEPGEVNQDVNEIVLDHIQKCTQEIVDECYTIGTLIGNPDDKSISDEERAFYDRTFSILKRAQRDWGQQRSTAGKEPSLIRVEKEIEKADDELAKLSTEMKQLQDPNGGNSGGGPQDAPQKRETLIKKLNEVECTHRNLKQVLGVPGIPQRDDGMIERAEYAECKSREHEHKIHEQDLIIDRLQRQVQCEKDYVASLSRMQAEMEESRSCLQQELLTKSQEAERSTVKMKNIQGQMGGRITEVEKLQQYVESTTRKSEGEKGMLKNKIKTNQDRMERAEEALQKAMIRVECLELENSKLQADMKTMAREIELLKPEAEAKKSLEEVVNKLQVHLRELQPMPELLKTAELRLQDEKNRTVQAEQRIGEQTRLIHELTFKIESQISTLRCMKDKVDQMAAENTQLHVRIEELTKQVILCNTTIGDINTVLHSKNELINQMNIKLEEKEGFSLKANKQLEEALAESTRLSCLVEERTQLLETQTKSKIKEMQEQLNSTKQEIKQLKAEKQDSECKYSSQMTDMREKLAQCDSVIHQMQSYIAYLKTSYANVFNDPNMAQVCNIPTLGS